MAFRNQETGAYPVTQKEIELLNPNVSFQDSFKEFPGYDWVDSTVPPEYDTLTQYLTEDYPKQIKGQWVQVWVVNDFTPEEIAERIAQQEAQAKQGNKEIAVRLLSEVDWTQMPDVNLTNKSDFTDYRAILRSIALNPPVVAEWPVKPEEIWGN